MSASKEELEFSDVNSVDSKFSSSPEYQLKKKATARLLNLLTNEEDAAEFAAKPLADAEWTAEYERERKADEEMEKTLRDRLAGTVEVIAW